MKRFDYNDFAKAVDDLALKLKDKNFDAILFAARGGAFLAASLAYKLNIRTMYAINCSNYSGTTKLATTKLQTLPQIEQNHTNLLFVDEIIDSGETLNAILDEMSNKYQNFNIYSTALFQRPTAKLKANLFLYETDEWIDFFWEDFEKSAI